MLWNSLPWLWLVVCSAYAQDLHRIVLLGLPRAGAERMHVFFTCHGVQSLHYCCDGQDAFPCATCGECLHAEWSHKNPNAWPACAPPSSSLTVWSRFDVESTDPFGYFLPQHFALSLLLDDETLFICNHRSNWPYGISRWHSMTQRILASFGRQENMRVTVPQYRARRKKAAARQFHVWLEESIDQQDKRLNVTMTSLREIDEQHRSHVRANVKDYPLVAWNVDVDEPPIAQLQRYFPQMEWNASCWKGMDGYDEGHLIL